MEKATSDHTLLQRAGDGDGQALASLYDRHVEAMLGLALTILGDRGDAEDLVHDVFLEAWQKAGTYDAGRASVRNWLMLRTRSRSIDRLRARRFTPSATDPGAGASDYTPTEALTEALGLVPMLSNLSEAQRRIIELSFFAGLNCNEIASQLGTPPSTIRSRLAAALDRLREGLDVGSVS